jgi:protein gp37
MTRRLQAMGLRNYRNGFKVATHPGSLKLPLQWRKPQRVFVNSMSDLFHEDVELSFIERVFSVMETASWHTFQILTKRSERLAEECTALNWPSNVWMGVSVENSYYINRIEDLKRTDAVVKFVSFEPLLSAIGPVDLDGIDWVVVGGESGPGSRPMEKEWVVEIKETCTRQGVPFFFKQWGGVRKKQNGRLLEGRTWSEMPVGVS